MQSNKEENVIRITKEVQGSSMILYLDGHLDALTTKELNPILENSLTGINHLTFDLNKLTYISSAGLRSLLIAQKAMGKQGKMVIRGVNDIVMETFRSIGFDRIMTII